MKIRSALILGITAILFLIPAMALGQGPANDDSDQVQVQELQIGDKVYVLDGVHKNRVGTISQFTGSMYQVDGLPHNYVGEQYFTPSQLERVDLKNQFQGIEDLRNAWRFVITSITGA